MIVPVFQLLISTIFLVKKDTFKEGRNGSDRLKGRQHIMQNRRQHHLRGFTEFILRDGVEIHQLILAVNSR